MIQIDHMKLFDRELGERFIEFSGIEAQSPSYASLLAITNLLLGEAQSQIETSLFDFGSLSFGEVPKRLKGARSANGAKRQTDK